MSLSSTKQRMLLNIWTKSLFFSIQKDLFRYHCSIAKVRKKAIKTKF